MSKLRYAKIEEGDFIPIIKLVKEDTEEVKKINSLYQREVEYLEFLGSFESFLAYYWYYDDQKLKDVSVTKTIRKIRDNLDKGIEFFKDDFEREFVGVINFVLSDNRKITKHEFLLVLKYILWSIDNRRHLGDSRGYLKWIANFFKLYNEKEKEEFDKSYNDYGAKTGLSEERIKLMKCENEEEVELPVNDIALSKLDSENFDEEDGLWKKGGFVQSISSEELEKKKKSFHMKHDEDVNYDCKKCGKKISLHNRDWHDEMCDECFDKEVYGE